MPSVRVPTVFAIAPVSPVDAPQTVLGELVAYPDRDVQWDKKLTLYSDGAPSWFNQWALAMGLPVERIGMRDIGWDDLAPREKDGKHLLILGGTADKKLIANKKTNVLVLEAGWFGDATGPASVTPAQMREGVAELAKQHWSRPLAFTSHRKPWPGVANRWAWITDDTGLPLVEEIRVLTWDERKLFPPAAKEQPPLLASKPQAETIARLVASYLPWQEQLGRNEIADVTLLALLTAAGGALPRDCQWSPAQVVYPPSADVTAPARPILSAVRSGRSWRQQDIPDGKPVYFPPINVIVDLRGPGPAIADELQGGARNLDPDNRQPTTRVIILGDDKVLDEWKWLKLDRAKKRIGRAGVQWLTDDELPPSKESQIRLMLKLTELGVPLSPPEQQERQK